MRVLSFAEGYRKKYQDESTKVSSVSVSRCAAPPQLGHAHARQAAAASLLRGEVPLPVKAKFSGSCTGKSRSGTGTVPQLGQVRWSSQGVPPLRLATETILGMMLPVTISVS